MPKEVISDKQGIALLTLFILGSSIVLGRGVEAQKDAWLAELIGIGFALLMVLIYARLLATFPRKDLFDIVEIVFGKIVGKMIGMLYIWFALHLGALVLRNFGEFIMNVALYKTPLAILILIIGFLCFWVVREGIEILGRWAEFFIGIVIFLTFLAIFLLIPKMHINYIQPILYHGMKPVMKGAFSVFAFPLAETILFTMCFSALKWQYSAYKVYIVGIFIGGLILMISTITTILVLGTEISATAYFPDYNVVRMIDMGDFLTRLEIIAAIVFMISGFIKASICLFTVSKGIAKVFGYTDYRFVVMPMALLMMNLSYLIYDNIVEMQKWAFEVWRYYAFPFQVILPVLMLVASEVKMRSRKRKKIV
ncbi:endospore germination permease [Clostridiaceae bacterium 35-E11]